MAYVNGVVTVGTSKVQVSVIGLHGALVQNVGSTTIYIGGPNVTADATATGGISFTSASPPLTIPGGAVELELGGVVSDSALLYAISSGAGGKLAYFAETTTSYLGGRMDAQSVEVPPGTAVYIAPDGTVVPVTGPVVIEQADGQEILADLPLGDA